MTFVSGLAVLVVTIVISVVVLNVALVAGLPVHAALILTGLSAFVGGFLTTRVV